jgi:outer membrane protein assembly factor BamB
MGTMGTMMYAVDINDGRAVWKKRLGDWGITRGQALLKGMLIQPTQGGNLYAIRPDGTVVWKIAKNHVFTSVTTDGERIYTGSEDLHYYCFDADGKVVWRFRMEGPVWQPATIHEGIVYFGSYDCNLYALDVKNGKLLWKFRCPGAPSTYPPIKSFFEVAIKLPEREFEAEPEKRYDLRIREDEDDGTGAYKSRITYQVSTRYASRGKYQVDSDEDGL